MNRIRKTFGALAVLMLLMSPIKAQVINFLASYDSLNFPVPDSAGFGDVVRYEFDLFNNTANIFQDSLKFRMRVNGGAPVLLGDSGIVFIAPQVSKHFIFDDSVLNGRYGGNINIVVIWPTSSTQPIACDTMRGWLFVDESSGIKDGLQRQPFDVELYPVPTDNALHFRLKDQQLMIVETVLFDAFGTPLRRVAGLPEQIPFSDLPAGVYFIRIQTEEGAFGHFKVSKR